MLIFLYLGILLYLAVTFISLITIIKYCYCQLKYFMKNSQYNINRFLNVINTNTNTHTNTSLIYNIL